MDDTELYTMLGQISRTVGENQAWVIRPGSAALINMPPITFPDLPSIDDLIGRPVKVNIGSMLRRGPFLTAEQLASMQAPTIDEAYESRKEQEQEAAKLLEIIDEMEDAEMRSVWRRARAQRVRDYSELRARVRNQLGLDAAPDAAPDDDGDDD